MQVSSVMLEKGFLPSSLLSVSSQRYGFCGVQIFVKGSPKMAEFGFWIFKKIHTSLALAFFLSFSFFFFNSCSNSEC